MHHVGWKKDISCFERIYIGHRKGAQLKVKLGQFYDRCSACKEEIFTTSDWLQAAVLKVHAYAGCHRPSKGQGSRCLEVDSKLQDTFRSMRTLLSASPQLLIG